MVKIKFGLCEAFSYELPAITSGNDDEFILWLFKSKCNGRSFRRAIGYDVVGRSHG